MVNIIIVLVFFVIHSVVTSATSSKKALQDIMTAIAVTKHWKGRTSQRKMCNVSPDDLAKIPCKVLSVCGTISDMLLR